MNTPADKDPILGMLVVFLIALLTCGCPIMIIVGILRMYFKF